MVIKISAKNSAQPTNIKINGEISTDPTKIATHFNQYFSTIAEKIQDKIHLPQIHFSKYLTNATTESFFANPTDKTGLLTDI